VELEVGKSCQDLRHVQPPDAYAVLIGRLLHLRVMHASIG
jgi:hypothetical protein